MKNKKFLLVAVAAMGLVAAGTAGVGTAAWFQATAAGVQVNANNDTENVSITTQSVTYQADNYTGTLTIVPYSTFNTGKTLVYSQWDSAWKHASDIYVK